MWVSNQCCILKAEPKLNKCCVLTTAESRMKIHPCGFSCCTFQGDGSVVVDSLFLIAPDVRGFFVFGTCFCNAVLTVLSKVLPH